MTLNDIATKLRMEAAYIGGSHYTLKEAEIIITRLAAELDETAMQLSIQLAKQLSEMNDITGINDKHRFLYMKQQNIKENADGSNNN